MIELWIDEGHGGRDPGVVSGDRQEKTLNLALSHETNRLAKVQGWDVKRTRSTDVFVSINDRWRRANAEGADVFISLHHDWTAGRQAVIFPKGTGTRVTQSSRLATAISKRIEHLAPTDSVARVDNRGLGVLNHTTMPAVLIEVSRVQDTYSVAAMAEGIVRGICDYMGLPFVVTRPPAKPVAPQTMFVTASSLNVRSGPSTEFRVVRQLARGASVSVTDNIGAWRRIGVGNYVHGSFLSTARPAVPVAPSPVATRPAGRAARVVNASFLNVRATASMKGRIVGVLRAGQHVTAGPTKDGWTQILTPHKGWAGSRFLENV